MVESWEWEYVPAGKRGDSEVCVFVYVHIRGQRVVIGRLCVQLYGGRGLSLQTWPGARQYCAKHNERP